MRTVLQSSDRQTILDKKTSDREFVGILQSYGLKTR